MKSLSSPETQNFYASIAEELKDPEIQTFVDIDSLYAEYGFAELPPESELATEMRTMTNEERVDTYIRVKKFLGETLTKQQAREELGIH